MLVGYEVPSGCKVAFPHEGMLENRYVTLYNVTKTDKLFKDAMVLYFDADSTWFPSNDPGVNDLGYAHDVCSGLGGFSTAFCFLGGRVITAVDHAKLACDAYALNFDCPCLQADIGSVDTVARMHHMQYQYSCQPIMMAGFPCQPLSRQGRQLRHLDARSQTLHHILRAAGWLRVAALILECVPEAFTDEATQTVIRKFALDFGYHLWQGTLQLSTIWPSNRSRWFAVLTIRSLPRVSVPPLPIVCPPPVVSSVIETWPCWPKGDRDQLQWTALENQVYLDPDFGSTNRRIDLSAPLPTALHSWGSALYACPCGCRDRGFSASTLRKGGLRGVAVHDSTTQTIRHIHPHELQLLLGFPPCQKCLEDCRASLCLLGNAVSPVQVIWILSHLFRQSGGVSSLEPEALLKNYLGCLLTQRDLMWLAECTATGTLLLEQDGVSCPIAFRPGAKLQHLLQAEAVFQQNPSECEVRCDGVLLPAQAFLQARKYTLCRVPDSSPFEIAPVCCQVLFLGHVRRFIVPSGMQVALFLHWAGIDGWRKVVNLQGEEVPGSDRIEGHSSLVIQQDPIDVDFDMLWVAQGPSQDAAIGYGLSTVGQLRLSPGWHGLGIGHLDELVKNNILTSWSGSHFRSLSVWLPSFAEAVLELWPSTVDDQLTSWLQTTQVPIFVIFLEDWGWNLLEISLDRLTTVIRFRTKTACTSTASLLAYRIQRASNRPCYREEFGIEAPTQAEEGSLAEILKHVDRYLNLPSGLREALWSVRSKYGAVRAFGSYCQLSATLPISFPEDQLPLPVAETQPTSALRGLSAQFILDFARALLCQYPTNIVSDQIKVLVLDTLGQVPKEVSKTFEGSPNPSFLFVLANEHWTLIKCEQQNHVVHLTQFDGLLDADTSHIRVLGGVLQHSWGCSGYALERTWNIPQTFRDSCGTIALGHFALCLGFITPQEAIGFEAIHPGLALCSEAFSPTWSPIGFGSDEETITKELVGLLPSKGVAAEDVPSRAQAAIKLFGTAAILKALQQKNPWASLKTLGNSKPRPFMWVSNSELQVHIQDRASKKFGVDADVKRTKKQRESKKLTPSASLLDPSLLQIHREVFATSTGQAVHQIQLAEVQKNAAGIAFATALEIQQFLSEGKLISPEALAVLVVGPIPDKFQSSLPMHQVRVPAMYKGTNEPILVDCVSVQLGDQAVYQKHNKAAPEVTVVPTVVFRVHIFRDLWEDGGWDELIAHPIRSLVQVFPILRLCREENCEGCQFYHPSLEEEGIESGLVDVWGFGWSRLDGSKTTPAKADTLAVYFRVPESSFDKLHVASGHQGVFFEPRQTSTPGPDERYAVIWIPQAGLQDVFHKIKTQDLALAACRLGSKYGIRCYARNQEQLHKALQLKKPFVNCTVKYVYRVEPLPAGTQRQSLADLLQAIGWVAKPLHACKGSQGQAWEVGSSLAPPDAFLESKHGWATITKIRDVGVKPHPQDLVATARTKQHIKGGATVESQAGKGTPSTLTDPWFSGQDPWGGYTGVSTGPKPPSQHVQQKFDDVEQRLQDSVKAQVTATVEEWATSMQTDNDSSDRLQTVETHVQTLMQHQSKLEAWITDGHNQIQSLKQDQAQVHQAVGQCMTTIQSQGQAISSVVQEVSQCSATIQEQGASLANVAKEVGGLKEQLGSTLAQYFDQQSTRLEALLEKKQRHA